MAPPELYDEIVFGKQPADLHTSTGTQMATYEVCRSQDGAFLDEHIEKIRDVYRERRDVMIRALEEHFPEGCTWTRAQGGLFVWAEVPPSIDTRELLAEALEENVAFVPGQSFHPDRSGHNTMRLNFSNVTRTASRRASPGWAARSSAGWRGRPRRPARASPSARSTRHLGSGFRSRTTDALPPSWRGTASIRAAQGGWVGGTESA